MKKYINKNFLILFFIIIVCIIISLLIKLKKKDNTNTSWTITQFGNNAAAQMMSFVIEGNESGLIIVDGGYSTSSEDINVIKEKVQNHNNHIDAWIVTHFDDDHAGVFDYFIENEKDVVIDKIFTQDITLDLDTIKADAQGSAECESYEKYLNFELNQEIKVHSGDEFENIIGLKMKVLSSFDEWMVGKESNYLNCGCMVFKLYGNEESILFTGDVQSKGIEEYLVNNYKDDLKSDYIQVPHHGNNSFSNDFYNIVSPKVAFFCTPEWIYKNENNISWYTASSQKAYLESIGAKVYSYDTTPNKIIMK